MAFIARWSFEVPFGKKTEVFDMLDRWEARAREMGWPPPRVVVGSIGVPEGIIESEYRFETLGELDAAWGKLGDQKFHKWQEEMAPFVVPGSHRWMIYRLHEPATARRAQPVRRGRATSAATTTTRRAGARPRVGETRLGR